MKSTFHPKDHATGERSSEQFVDAYYFCGTIIEFYLMQHLCVIPELSSTYWLSCDVRSDNTNYTIFYDLETPQGKAFDWISRDPLTASLMCTETDYTDDVTILQRYALAVLFFSTGGHLKYSTDYEEVHAVLDAKEEWTSHGSLNFLTSGAHECEWHVKHDGVLLGVKTCDKSTNLVTELVLSEVSLEGTIPEEIGLLSSLEVLNFQSNFLSGYLPQSFGRLSNLRLLALGHNNFIGTLPKRMGSLLDLETLYINFNNMHGEDVLPASVCDLYRHGRLFNLWADCNRISDPVVCDCCIMCCDSMSTCEANVPYDAEGSSDDDSDENYMTGDVSVSSTTHRDKRAKQRKEEDVHHKEQWFGW